MMSENSVLGEVIKLQLRKPKNWNWELSTSKSSPHIALPVIQLYNSKGQLLIQTEDVGLQRNSWNNFEVHKNIKNKAAANQSIPQYLQRCKSDTLTKLNKYDLNIRRNKQPERKQKELGRSSTEHISTNSTFAGNERRYEHSKSALVNNLQKSKSAVNAIPSLDLKNRIRSNRDFAKQSIIQYNQRCKSDNLSCKYDKSNDLDFELKQRELSRSRTNEVTRSGKPNASGTNLQKSRSAVDARQNTFFECFQRNSPRKNKHSNESENYQHHRRTNSDDLFRRILRYSEESIKRSIEDGYRNFITPHPVRDRTSKETPKETPEKACPPKNKYVKSKIERGTVEDNAQNMGEVILHNKKYRTRTSSAGTLIISEESFSCPVRRRRRPQMEEPTQPKRSHVRNISDPTTITRLKKATEDLKRLAERPQTLFYSHSDIFPVMEIEDEKCYDKCDYTVQEPITPSSSDKNRNVTDSGDSDSRKNVPLQNGYHSVSPNSAQKCKESQCEKKQKDIEAYAINSLQNGNSTKLPDDEDDKPDGDLELLRLVRRLSTDNVIKMGANVSRHSSKGLSGRRSQSSGSICNGKNRHGNAEPKICGSLPSYLDERDGSNGCNNNHQFEKQNEDDQRIPPLGDGAPLHWKFSDNQTALCDQGYGSERSPEEEYPPPLPEHDNQCHRHLEPHACYPFITPESTFCVSLSKGSRGLGLSVTGGIDSVGSWPGLIRVKRLFPHQLAAACGLLNVGDILLEANGIPLTGLTNYEAVEVLRTTPNQVELKVCRPPPDVLNCVSPISEVPPPPPRRDPPTSLNLTSSAYSTTPPEDDSYHGEFEVTLTKIQGSLGFTLRKEDDSALGHYVRALVREPALTDGRIHAGDKIIAVNGVEISPMTHEQAVQFLRQSGDVVRLRLYRDAAQTPVAALSPTETTPRTSFSKKTHLRQEAVDMLNDIAVKKLIPGNQGCQRRSASPTASPRRLRRHPCPSNASHIDTSSNCTLSDDQFHEGLLQKCSIPFDDESFNSLFSADSDEFDKPSRPNSLDLYNPNQTPVATRKPRFNFSLAHNAYELNNLDPEVLDAPNLTYNLGADDGNSTEAECGDSFPQEPASMPYMPVENPGFSYKNPAYQTAHPNCGSENSEDKNQKAADDNNMKKWKGVVFNADDEREKNEQLAMLQNDTQILAIELNRGWNSRLGFSLQGAAGYTYVSAVYSDSVAAKDGRLKPGDRLIKVNDESVEKMTTSEIIDLLRIVRGPVCIVVSRTKSKDCTKSNAVN